MSELEALLLGIVQGLTVPADLLLGAPDPRPWLQDYTFLEHTIPSTRPSTSPPRRHAGGRDLYFRHEVVAFTLAFFHSLRKRAIETVDERLSWAIAIGTVPAVIAGGLGAGFIETTSASHG